jgi:hypothetical protein
MPGIPLRFSLPIKDKIEVTLDVAKPIGDEPKVGEDGVPPPAPKYETPVFQTFEFPAFTRGDWIRWRKAVDADRLAAAMEVLSPEEQSRTLMAYPLRPLTNREMRQMLDTDEGTGYVFAVCAKNAGVPAHAIRRAVEYGDCDEVDLESLSLMLARVVNPHDVARKLAKQRREVAQDEGDFEAGASDEEKENVGMGDGIGWQPGRAQMLGYRPNSSEDKESVKDRAAGVPDGSADPLPSRGT